MRHMRLVLAAALIVAGFATSGVASAHGYWGGPRFGFDFVVPLYPYGYYRPYYYDPPVVVQEPPPVVVAPSAAPQSYSWYYCAESKMYYPYAKECPSGWQAVAPQPQEPAQPAAPR
jgi:hypothetical protein